MTDTHGSNSIAGEKLLSLIERLDQLRQESGASMSVTVENLCARGLERTTAPAAR